MDISRLDYYRFLDIQIIASNFMELCVEICSRTPSAQELVAFAADKMGTLDYNDPQHYMYDYLLYLAKETLAELESKDS